MIAVDLARQLLPGTFAHALHHLFDHDVDLSHFDARFQNDATGAPAYPPALLLKVVLFAYSQGIVSSRAIARARQEHVTFMALCGDHAPHFTTIARFVSEASSRATPASQQSMRHIRSLSMGKRMAPDRKRNCCCRS